MKFKNTQKILLALSSLLIFFTFQDTFIQSNKISKQPFILTVRAEEDSEEEKDEKDESEAQNEAEEEVEKVDEDNESPFLYTTDTGQLQVQTTGDELQADIYLVIQDKEENERTIYVSPYRDSKNEQRVPAGEYTIKEIYLLDKDYQDTYEFEHNEKLIVFPDEKVFFDIEVIEIKESKPNELLKNQELEEEQEETEIEVGTQSEEQTESNNILFMSISIGAVILGGLGFAFLKYFGFIGK